MVDDIIAISTKNEFGNILKAYKVKGIDLSNGEYKINISQPNFYEAFNSINIHKNYLMVKDNFKLNTDLLKEKGLKVEIQENKIVVSVDKDSIDKSLNVNANIEIAYPIISLDYEWAASTGLKEFNLNLINRREVDVKLNYNGINDNANGEYKNIDEIFKAEKDGNGKNAKDTFTYNQTLGKIQIPIGNTGLVFTGNLSLLCNIDSMGKYKYNLEVNNLSNYGIHYEDGKFKSFSGGSLFKTDLNEMDIKGESKASIEVEPYIQFEAFMVPSSAVHGQGGLLADFVGIGKVDKLNSIQPSSNLQLTAGMSSQGGSKVFSDMNNGKVLITNILRKNYSNFGY